MGPVVYSAVEHMNNTLQILTISSRFALAAAIVYFAYQLARIVDVLPELDQSLAQVKQTVPPAIEVIEKVRVEMSEMRRLVPEILDESAAIREQIPPILQEVAEVRQSVPPVLDEVAKTRLQLPSVLERVDKTVSVVDQTQRQIPKILATANKATDSVDKTRTQIEILTPEVLSEVRMTRQMIDPTLDRVDGLINDVYLKAQETVTTAEDAGQEASEGAVTGVVTGVLKLPFRLIGSLLSPFFGSIDPDMALQLTQKDVELMGDAGKRASASGKLNQQHEWRNPDSGNSGSISLVSRFQLEKSECVEVFITIAISGKSTIDKLESFCQNKAGKWVAAPVREN